MVRPTGISTGATAWQIKLSMYPSLEIIDLSKQAPNGLVTTKVTVFNQRNELVLLGEHKYLLKAS
jgi:acyl dehydratase